MGGRIHRLNALAVTRASTPGMYADGAGLYLQVTHADARSWIFRYSLRGKPREMGLGSLVTFRTTPVYPASARPAMAPSTDRILPMGFPGE